MIYHCYKCNETEVAKEFERCPPCQAEHIKLCAKLDARPKNHIKPVKEELFPIKEMKQGIMVTTYIDRNDAANMGIKLPQ